MIPEGTRTIKYAAYAGCDTLEEIVIPDSVTDIGGAAFRGCTALRKAVLPSKIKVLPQSIFEGCTSLEEIIIPDSVTVIEDYAFAGCTALKNIALPEGIFAVEHRAFQDAACEGRVVYKGTPKRLHGRTLFSRKDHQTHIDIPEGVITLDENCFKDYAELETVTFPQSLKWIGSSCFSGCSALKEIHLPEGVKTEWYSFEKCDSLVTVEIPENCTVGQGGFRQCKNLTTLILPHKAEIAWSAFYDCPSLQTVYVPAGTDYHQLLKRLPDSCSILNLDGKDASYMRMKIQEWNGTLPEEAVSDSEKLRGLPLDEQLKHCYIVESTTEESCSYGETDKEKTHESRIRLKRAYDLDILLVQNGTVVGFINMDGKTIFLGQICKAYSSVDSDGTGSTYSSSVSRLEVLDL